MEHSILYKAYRAFCKVGWFLPGFILWAAFPPMGERGDVLFALAPLMWLSRQGEVRRSVVAWTKSGLFFWVATLSWMPAIVKNGGPWPLVGLGWFALAAYCTLYFAAYGYLSATYWRFANQRKGLRLLGILLVEPILWSGLELTRSTLFGGFAWNPLGLVPINGGFASPAALGGVYLCSAVIILINGTFAGIGERVVASLKRRPLSPWRTLETLLAFLVVFGIYRAANFLESGRREVASGEFVNVALIQRNFPCCFQENRENPIEVYDRLLGNVANLKPQLVVLPESAMAEIGPLNSSRTLQFLADLSQKAGGARVIAGGGRYERGKAYNSAISYPDLSIYDKVHLVPFGEFIPGDKLWPYLQRFAPVGSCTSGEKRLLGDFGVAICYEDTDSSLMREYASMGAKALVFITNDSWFSHSIEAEAHSWQAVARAAETGLPVIRVGNSGVTGTISRKLEANWLVDACGRPIVDKGASMFDRLELKAVKAGPTWYVCLGDLPLLIAFLLLITSLIMIKYTHECE